MLRATSISHIGFFIPGNGTTAALTPEADQRLSLIRRAEALGYDSAWVERPREQQCGFGDFLDAAIRDTRRIAIGFGCGRQELGRLADARLHAEIGSGGPADAGRGPLRVLGSRVWCDADSPGAAAWAGASGFNLVIDTACATGEGHGAQGDSLALIEAYWNAHAGEAPPRILANRIILPFDGADRATRERYEEFALAARHGDPTPRSPDPAILAGFAGAIVEALRRDPVLLHVTELRLALPRGFPPRDHEQILADFRRLVAPRLGHGLLH